MRWPRGIGISGRVFECSSEKWSRVRMRRKCWLMSFWVRSLGGPRLGRSSLMRFWCFCIRMSRITPKVRFSRFRILFLGRRSRGRRRRCRICKWKINRNEIFLYESITNFSKQTKANSSSKTTIQNLSNAKNFSKVILKTIRSSKQVCLLIIPAEISSRYQILAKKYGRWFQRKLKVWRIERRSTRFCRRIIWFLSTWCWTETRRM